MATARGSFRIADFPNVFFIIISSILYARDRGGLLRRRLQYVCILNHKAFLITRQTRQNGCTIRIEEGDDLLECFCKYIAWISRRESAVRSFTHSNCCSYYAV